MEFLLSLLVGIIFVGLIGFIVFRAIRTNQLPENDNTPFDEDMDESTEGDEHSS